MSFADKIQQNKGLSLAFGGLLAAGGLAYYFFNKHRDERGSDEVQKLCPHSAKKVQSVYDKLGGKENIALAVTKFYDKVLKDDRVKHFFKHTDMKHQTKQQTNFLCFAFGGPNNYVGKNMKDGHKGMNIDDSQFNAIVELLAQTLTEMGVPQDVIGEIAAICEPLRKDICFQ
ncbi:protozoan/cyanobacterial globin family protein (macronuclear) [Tetrahymena thermophila SB210]|uniref:Protozoan/cyanobacterial globin family protein n=1 Tax=Tetrahymena thermophila (strain SB210) TaxID=312017 RepID=Q22YY3_TETTS|nr:protozoan/cyanobacterial globin family protein [Tetrahymena thermophila SB210]EAR90538.1 protozoan/cyanobacterial globin family protein [Tetrahymena thermophila SB210]|eukprot:XP_001010783.1 protozoan/cyanobacterial globin family protein [Tetrahymena thermophila SB210]